MIFNLPDGSLPGLQITNSLNLGPETFCQKGNIKNNACFQKKKTYMFSEKHVRLFLKAL